MIVTHHSTSVNSGQNILMWTRTLQQILCLSLQLSRYDVKNLFLLLVMKRKLARGCNWMNFEILIRLFVLSIISPTSLMKENVVG